MQRFLRLSGQGACRSIACMALALVAAGVLSLLVVTPSLAAPLQQGVIYPIRVSDVNNVKFTVSWTTRDPSNGQVEWGTTIALSNTTADPVANSTTHYVNITGLIPNRLYYFRVRSGSLVDDNGGALYTVTTGPTILYTPPSLNVDGTVYQSGGVLLAANVIIYLRVRDVDGLPSPGYSQWVTYRTDGFGTWAINLGNVRTVTGTAYYLFTPDADYLEITAQGGISGTAILSMPAPPTYPATLPNMTLNDLPTAVRLAEFKADSAPMTPVLPAVAFVALSIVGLVLWQRYRQRPSA